MAKSPDAFRTISEVSDWLDTPAHVLRFWESKFPQIKPVKRAGGRRYYRPEDMTLLGGIKALLHDQGMTIKGVQKMLRERGSRAVAGLSPPLGAFEGAGALIELEPGEELTTLDGPDLAPAQPLDMAAQPVSAARAKPSPPIAAPIAAPIATPLAAPSAAPLATPFAAPIAAPFAAPFAAADPVAGAPLAVAPPAPPRPVSIPDAPPSAGLLSQILALPRPLPAAQARKAAPLLARLERLVRRMAAAGAQG